MEAKDLMIDDWVYDTILQGYTRVKVLTARGVKGDIHDNIWDEDTFAPIPLTPEILEKNGFINGEFYAESLIEDWQILSDCSHLAARHSSGWFLDIQCEYVHQLQQALRLCGIKKEITI